MNRSLLFASLLLATATLQAQDPKPATPVTTTPAATEPQAVAPATLPSSQTAGAASEHLEAQVLLERTRQYVQAAQDYLGEPQCPIGAASALVRNDSPVNVETLVT